MTLATVPRYDSDRITAVGNHAVVVGASMAGLLAARVLADAYETVTVVDRDDLPDRSVARDGVPQARHPHALQEAGRATIEDLFAGYGQDLLAAGGLLIDAATDFRFRDEGAFLADGPRRMPMYTASRPLFEHVARRRLAARDDVTIRPGCRCTDYRLDDSGTTVTGVVVRDATTNAPGDGDGGGSGGGGGTGGGDAVGGRRVVEADLVVDATGRPSRTPRWLADNGFDRPPLDEVHVDLAYSTVVIERPPEDRRALWAPAGPPHTRGGGVAPIEDGYWQVVLHGVHGDHPPTDLEGFERFAASLPFPDIAALLDDHRYATDAVEHYPFPSNRRYRYERVDELPDGLLVIGDAIASYNPIYGQGISVAALEALVLHHLLAAGRRDGLCRRYFQRAADVTDLAWQLAVGADFQFDATTGPKPRGTDLMGRYLSKLTRAAHADGHLRDALFRVIMMEVPPTTLLRPGVLWRVFRPTRPADRPTSTPASTERSREPT